ncbi:MAG: NAD-dependent epimerase/dehydratase family protein [Chlamydiae bacterium]|nr:NAD-dependent epimerase/dehydratase family protein [Chlamydiota bacterium]
MSKKILITGSAGFLGSHLVEHHLSMGDVVYGIDNFSSSKPSSKHHQNLIKNSGYFFVCGDITDSYIINDAFGVIALKKNFDKIYNFACPASPPRYQEIPIETMMTCVVGTKNVLSLASSSTVVLHASTSEVYGDPSINPQPESYRGSVNSYGPRSCYDEGKRAAEALCYDYRNKFNVDTRLVRIFNTYGPQMDLRDGRVITNFIDQSLRGNPLTVYGDGSQTRSFCYVSDLIRGIVSLADLKENPKTPVNLGNPEEFTILELAKKMSKNFNVKIEHRLLPIDDPLQRRPDITIAKSILGWKPLVNLDEGLSRTIDYFRSCDA